MNDEVHGDEKHWLLVDIQFDNFCIFMKVFFFILSIPIFGTIFNYILGNELNDFFSLKNFLIGLFIWCIFFLFFGFLYIIIKVMFYNCKKYLNLYQKYTSSNK